MANKIFDFLLSGINSLVKLGKGGNTLESHVDSHVEFKKPNGDLVNVRTANPIDLKDSVNLEFLRENVLLSYGAPVQNLAQLRAIPLSQRRDKQIRLVEDEQAFYQFDAESMLVVPDPDNPNLAVLPNDISLALPGRWIKSRGRTQYHADLIGNDSGDDHPQYQLRNEKDQPTGYLGLDNNGRLNATTDELDEGGDNLYFTPERAREASVEDEINEGETEKAPSQDAVFQELAGKEPNLPSDGSPNEFLDGTKTFRNVEIQDIPGLEAGIQAAYDLIDQLNNTKEPNLPPGAPGTYLHSDKTFKQIDYSEIAGTPPPSSGADPNEVVFIFSNFSDLQRKVYSDWNTLLTDFNNIPSNRRKVIILEQNATWDLDGKNLFYDFSKTRIIGKPRIPIQNPQISSSLNNIYRNISRPRLIMRNTPFQTMMTPPMSLENIAIVIESSVKRSIADSEKSIFAGKKSDFDILLKDFSFFIEAFAEVSLLEVAGGFGSGTNIILDGEIEIHRDPTGNNSGSLVKYITTYSDSENHNIVIKPSCMGAVSMVSLIGNTLGFSDLSNNDKLKIYMGSISLSLERDLPDYLTTASRIRLIDMRFRASTQGKGSTGNDDFDSMISLGGKQIRNDLHPLTVTGTDSNLQPTEVLRCDVSGMYSKRANGNSTIFIWNMTIGQQVILEVESNGLPSVLNFMNGQNTPFIWVDGAQPPATVQSGKYDLYIFMRSISRIYVSTMMGI